MHVHVPTELEYAPDCPKKLCLALLLEDRAEGLGGKVRHSYFHGSRQEESEGAQSEKGVFGAADFAKAGPDGWRG